MIHVACCQTKYNSKCEKNTNICFVLICLLLVLSVTIKVEQRLVDAAHLRFNDHLMTLSSTTRH